MDDNSDIDYAIKFVEAFTDPNNYKSVNTAVTSYTYSTIELMESHNNKVGREVSYSILHYNNKFIYRICFIVIADEEIL